MSTHKDALRFDLGQITSIERTPQGFLKIPGFATRTGVFVYRDATGGIRRELRHPDDVFAPESLLTLKNVPVTLEHPPVMVTPENFKIYSRGYTTDRVDINRDLVETDLIVAEAEAIDSVETKERRELSCGYLADLVEERGTFNGAAYDYRQKNIRYNHLAIVRSGRGGPEIRLRMDSADAVLIPAKKVVIMGEEIELPGPQATVVENLLNSYDDMKGRVYKLEAEAMKDKKDVDVSQKGVSPKVPEVQEAPDGRDAGKKIDEGDEKGAGRAKGLDADEEKKKEDADEEKKKEDGEEKKEDAEELKKQLDAMTAKCDALEEKLKEKGDTQISPPVSGKPSGAPQFDRKDSAEFHKAVKARLNLVKAAEHFVSRDTAAKFDSMSDDEIRVAAIAARHPKSDLTGKSSTYLEVRFDSMAADVAASESVRRDMGSNFMARMDGGDATDPRAAREKARNDAKDDYKQPLSAVKK